MPTPESGLDTGSRRVEEMVVASSQGEVFYAWECREVEERLKLLEFLQTKAKNLGSTLALGRLERLECEGPQGRIIARFHSDWKVWVRARDIENREAE
jgi:hypothetical protein